MRKLVHRYPQNGDHVVDHSKVLNQEGMISGGVWDHTDVRREKLIDCFVVFSSTQHNWYLPSELNPCWDPETKKYHIGDD